MNQDNHDDADDLLESLRVEEDAPWITMRVLSEFIFCPRAGLIALEEKREDRGDDLDRSPRLDYLPNYDLWELEETLQETWTRVWRFVTIAPAVAIVIAIIGLLFSWKLAAVLFVSSLFFVWWFIQQVWIVIVLAPRLKAAQQATGERPDDDLTENEPVNWWALLKSGFESREYDGPHEDMELRLSGWPWRVLYDGSLRIPVFRKRRGKPKLRPQQEARMAAYCHLLSTIEQMNAPYGVVLFGEGYDGVAVPNSQANRKKFAEGLAECRRLFESIEPEDLKLGDPKDKSICLGCHYGRPRLHRIGKSETILMGEVVEPVRTRAKNQKIYHSTCGDRFSWVPPHAWAKEKDMC